MPFTIKEEPRSPRWPAILATVASVAGILSGLAVVLPAAGAMQITTVVASAAPAAQATVWYNRRTGVFHDASCRYFLRTADGRQLPLDLAAQVGRPCHTCIVAPSLRTGVIKTQSEVGKRIYVLP